MVSIIIPIYNSERYLNECLNSIVEQSFKDFEVICIDDGSHDRSRQICREYESKDNRFKYFYQENGGVSKARNSGIKYSKGNFICFVDSDDIVHKDFLLHLVAHSKDSDLVICDYTRNLQNLGDSKDIVKSYEANSFIKKVINEEIKHPNICMMLFRADIIKDKDLAFVVGCVRNEDAEFYLKYMSHISNIIWTDFKGYYYRDNESSAANTFNKKSLTYIEASTRIKNYLASVGIVDDKCKIVDASVQYFVYHLARQGNKDLYDYVHGRYNVKNAMRNLVSFPRKSRRLVAFLYLVLGGNNFYKILSKLLSE